jgi:class 3 adenylate cyclase/tetratricopeptide (TPR) repeat protein
MVVVSLVLPMGYDQGTQVGAPSMQSKLAVIMFADIVGYTAMMEADQARAVANVRALKTEFLEPVAIRHGGRVLKRLGDGWIIAFEAIAACVACAMEVQTAMNGLPDVALRIGCHFGDIVEDHDDVYGNGLNVAERIQAESPPGGLMVSEDVYRQLSGGHADALKDAGVFRLKNISQPVRLYQWRPARAVGANAGEATSIAVAAMEFAPQTEETAALAGDLRDQLFIRLSRRVGIVVYDAVAKTPENATYDLRSRLRVSSGRGRLSLTLVLRADGRPVWSESYDRDTGDIFDFCDVVLERAEADLRLQTNAFDGNRLAHIPDDALSVSELRARSANLYYSMSYDNWAHGLVLMERAIALNPLDGIALSMRAEGEVMLHAARYEDLTEPLLADLAKGLDLAVEQSPGSDYVYWARGIFRINCLKDSAAAKLDLSQSRRLNPAYSEAHELEGHISMLDGDFAKAAACFDRLIERQTHNPLLPYRQFLRAAALFCAGRFDEATTQARLAADARPSDRLLHAFVALSAEAAGESRIADHFRSKAATLTPAPSICARRLVLPDDHAELTDVLAAHLPNG